MSLLQKLLSRLPQAQRPKPGEPRPMAYPLGLNQGQVESLRHLRSIPQYKALTEALNAVCENELKLLISGLSHDQYLVKCGRVQMLMDVLTLPDTIDLKAKELDDHARSASVPVDPAKRDLTFWGSPFWNKRGGTVTDLAAAMESAGQRPSRLG